MIAWRRVYDLIFRRRNIEVSQSTTTLSRNVSTRASRSFERSNETETLF